MHHPPEKFSRFEKCLAITGQKLSSNTEIYFSVFIFPSTGVSVPTPWYDMHPQNITDAQRVVSQLSRRFLGHDSTFVPFPKQSSANCSRWNITASSLIKSCCYIFQSLSFCLFSNYEKESCRPEESSFVYPHFVASCQCFLFLSSASKISGLFYCLCLSYSVLYSSKNLQLTNLQLFLSARGLVPYRAVPLLLSRRYFVYLRGIIKLCATAGKL